MKCSALHPFGFELHGLSIDSVDDAEADLIRRRVTEGSVVVIRSQEIDDDAFVRFLERFEPLTFTAGERPVDGQPKLNVVTNVGRKTPPRSVFHTDTSYVKRPPSFTALRAVSLPAEGGETLFSNQYLAYDALPDLAKRELRNAVIRHVVSGLNLDDKDESESWHPLFRRHPETGRTALYLSTPERCVDVSEATVSNARALIEDLYRHSTEPERVYVHCWQAGDVVMWDNRCAMHRADHSAVVGDRVMHRGMCEGEEPIAA